MSSDKKESREHEASEQKIQKSKESGDDIVVNELRSSVQFIINLVFFLAFLVISISLFKQGAVEVFEFRVGTLKVLELTRMPAGFLLFAVVILSGLTLGLILGCALMASTVAPIRLNLSKLQPKSSRVSPLEVIKQKYGTIGWWGWGLAIAKLVSCVVIFFFLIDFRSPSSAIRAGTGSGMDLVIGLGVGALKLLFAFGVVQLLAGLVDFLVQRESYLNRLRMTREEVLEEQKESEGNPQMKGRRGQKAREIASFGGREAVATADFVFVNPTHISVAIVWDKSSNSLPVVCAKGQDGIALLIREIASLEHVPIISNVEMARSIFGSCQIGEPILRQHFKAVATAFNFIEKIKNRT